VPLKTSDRHQEFGGSDIAQHFELPFIAPHLVTCRPISNLLFAVLEQSVRNLVRNRIPKTTAGSGWVVFDADSGITLWNCSRITNVGSWENGNTQNSTQGDGVERRARPALVHRAQHRLSGPFLYDFERIARSREQSYRGIGPAVGFHFHYFVRFLD
jgi:hypothetical protein